MHKGGTQAPVRRKTAGHKIGDKVRCIHAATNWHRVGSVSEVVPHPVSGLPSVQARDGMYDELVMCSSRFEAIQ